LGAVRDEVDTVRSPLPVRRRMSKAEREQQILDIAEQLFIDHGFADTSIEDICRAAGISRPIVYEHFGSKDGVYLSCVRRARRQYEQETADNAAKSAALPLAERFASGSRIYFGLLAEDPRRWELLFARTGMLGDTLADEITEERAKTTRLLAQVYQADVPNADPGLVLAAAYAMSGCAEQLGRWWLQHPDVSLDEVVDLNTQFIVPLVETLVVRPRVGLPGED
jgi:AcrR family transcriptional regulator